MDRLKKTAMDLVTQNQQTVLCEVLTDRGQSVQCDVLPDIGQSVENSGGPSDTKPTDNH